MLYARIIAVASAGLILVLLSGCVPTRGRLIQAADRLEGRADALTRYAPQGGHGVGGDGGYYEQARGFADQTRDFRQTVGRRRTGDLDIVYAFQDLWRSYHRLLEQAESARGHQARRDLKPVKQAFVDVQRIVRNGYSSADSTVYARGGYVLDPYYN
jgi:hypothetical protein